MIDYKLIGSRLKTQRSTQKMTQEYVAEQAGITVVYLSKIENGHVKPTIDVPDAICDAIGCDVSSLFNGTSVSSAEYRNERVVELYRKCRPELKPTILELLEKMSQI